MRKFFGEFKKFITRGNVFDMAVGLIIATAFNKIVSSMVNDMIMPLITYALGASSLAELSIPLRWEWVDGVKNITLSWNYGNFIQTIIDFLIIAFSVFIMVKVVNTSRERLKEMAEDIEQMTSKEFKAERKAVRHQAKQERRKFRQVWKEHIEAKERLKKEKAEFEAKQKAEKEAEEKKNNPSEQELLKEIRDLLKEKNVK